MRTEEKIKEVFSKKFNQECIIVKSPGRINLIGEHTDYNNGFVLPASIDKYIYAAIQKREDNEIQLVSIDFNEEHTNSVDNLAKPDDWRWPMYILGVVDQIKKAGYTISGFNMVIDGDVPIGAGMSSSAALECATAFALNEMFNLGIDKMTMVKMAQMAEHEYAGVRCGIMDMFASMFGKDEHVIQLDCRSLEYKYVPFRFKDIKIVLFDTGVKHSLASGEYNIRRQQCEEGVALIQQKYPQVQSLRDATIDMVNECIDKANELVYNRCKFVVEEIKRLQDACADLEKDDLVAFGKKMYDTHHGLSKLYEVSCEELDILADEAKNYPAILGSRMMGGGFGGCTINLIKNDGLEEAVAGITAAYKKATGKEARVIITNIESGTRVC